MTNSFFDQRLGLLGYPGTTGVKAGDADFAQMVAYAASLGTAFGKILGASGGAVFSGGAHVVGDLTGGGKNYPATLGVCVDGTVPPVSYPFQTTAAQAMNFAVTSGACTVYAVPVAMAGITPKNVVGGIGQVQFLVQLTATTAPVAGLALGSGSVTASAFTTFTPASFAPATALLNMGFAYQGAWVNTTNYSVGQLVTYGGNTYICLVANVSSEPDLYPAKWAALLGFGVEQTLTNDASQVPSGAAVTAAIAAIAPPPNPVRIFPWPWSGCVLGAATTGYYAGFSAPQVQDLTEGPGGRNYVQVAAPLVNGVQDPGAYTQAFQWEWYLPTEWMGWQADAVGFDFLTSNNGGTASLGLAVYHNTSATPVYSATGLTTADAWQTAFVTATELSGVTWAAGDRLTVILTASCTGAVAIWLGNVSIGMEQA